jgi:hypothetical protein
MSDDEVLSRMFYTTLRLRQGLIRSTFLHRNIDIYCRWSRDHQVHLSPFPSQNIYLITPFQILAPR